MNNSTTHEMSSPQEHYPGMYKQEDDIDLFAVLFAIFDQWRWLAGITFVGTLIALVIALGVQKAYEVDARLAQPTRADVQIINVKGYSQPVTQLSRQDKDIKEEQDRLALPQKKLFSAFYAQLRSADNMKDFIVKNGWLSKLNPDATASEERQFEDIYENLSIEVLEPKKTKGEQNDSPPTLLGVKFAVKDEALGVKLVNDYINYTSQHILETMAEEGKTLRDLEKESIELKIAALRKQAAMERATKLVELTAAYDIASAMAIKKPEMLSVFQRMDGWMEGRVEGRMEGRVEGRAQITQGDGVLNKNVLALMGTEYLQSAIKNLSSRASVDSFIEQIPELKKQLADKKTEAEIEAFKNLVINDPYIEELPDLMSRLAELNQLTFDFNNAQSFHFEKTATMDGKTKKSGRSLIVVSGFGLSAMIAIFYVLIMNAYRKRSAES
jgi:LPS O-antigen subunit length determinant protein (WzzB/FepE family)